MALAWENLLIPTAAPSPNHNGKRWEETPSHSCIHQHSEGWWQWQRQGGSSTKDPTWAWLNLQPLGDLQHFPVPGQFTSEPDYLLQYCGQVLQPVCRGLWCAGAPPEHSRWKIWDFYLYTTAWPGEWQLNSRGTGREKQPGKAGRAGEVPGIPGKWWPSRVLRAPSPSSLGIFPQLIHSALWQCEVALRALLRMSKWRKQHVKKVKAATGQTPRSGVCFSGKALMRINQILHMQRDFHELLEGRNGWENEWKAKLFFFPVNFSFWGLNFRIILIFSKLKEITERFISGPKKNFLYQNTSACDFPVSTFLRYFVFQIWKNWQQ